MMIIETKNAVSWNGVEGVSGTFLHGLPFILLALLSEVIDLIAVSNVNVIKDMLPSGAPPQ